MNGSRRLGYTIRSSDAVAWPALQGGASSVLRPWANLLDETGGGGEGGEFGNEYACFSIAQSYLR